MWGREGRGVCVFVYVSLCVHITRVNDEWGGISATVSMAMILVS